MVMYDISSLRQISLGHQALSVIALHPVVYKEMNLTVQSKPRINIRKLLHLCFVRRNALFFYLEMRHNALTARCTRTLWELAAVPNPLIGPKEGDIKEFTIRQLSR